MTGYILINKDLQAPVCNELTKEIIFYPNVELALIAANKTVIQVKAVKATLTYDETWNTQSFKSVLQRSLSIQAWKGTRKN